MASRQHKKVPTSNASDRCQTPQYALDPLYPYLRPHWIIWECACGECNLVNGLRSKGYQVFAGDIFNGQDFFKYQPSRFDMILTNPPYSLKIPFLQRCYDLGKPFALLLPVEILGVGAAQRMFERYGMEVLLLNRRIDFATVNTSFEKSSSWFPSAWFCSGLNIGQQITYANITKRPDSQLPLFAPFDKAQDVPGGLAGISASHPLGGGRNSP